MAEASTAGAAPPEVPPQGTARRRFGALRAIWLGAALAALLLVGGFFWFVGQLARTEPTIEQGSDAIVALTGAAFRINDALALLAAGRGHRLLITGVNPATRSVEILRLMPEHRRWFDCCVDLDHSALNTIGNAVETRRWVRQRNFRSLIVVTSNFHMPRAMAELAHQLPDVALVPYPVISERAPVDAWWSNAALARLLISEYLKYIVAVVRIRLEAVFG